MAQRQTITRGALAPVRAGSQVSTAASALRLMRDAGWTASAIALTLVLVSPAWGTTREAARQVAEGIARHRRGDYAGAEQSFTAAAKALPDDPRLAFDRACALAAQKKYDAAQKLLQQAKLARDPGLTAASLYNLGCLAADQARARFGPHPEEASPEVRSEGLKFVEQAVFSFRDCLAADPNHANARHNLELLRLWVKHIQEVWRQRDRDQRRKEMGLLEFLEMLQAEQLAIREQSRWLLPLEDSPRRRQAATLLGQSQRELSEEMGPLQQKLRDGLRSPPADTTGPDPPSENPEMETALAVLVEQAQLARSAMSRAAVDLSANQLTSVEAAQNQALELLDRIYRFVAPFEHVLRKAIGVEETLIAATRGLEAKAAPEGEMAPRIADLPPDQRQVAGWADVLVSKAQQGLEELNSQAGALGPPPLPGPTDPAAASQDLRAAYEKALELGPRATSAASDAAASLDRRDWPAALPKQEEALRLLQEIADQLPKQPNQDQKPDQKNERANQPNQQNQENKEQDQQKNKQSDSSQPQPDRSQQKDQQQDLSQKQVEALLRQVREREREYREQQKRRQAVVGGVKVEKDW